MTEEYGISNHDMLLSTSPAPTERLSSVFVLSMLLLVLAPAAITAWILLRRKEHRDNSEDSILNWKNIYEGRSLKQNTTSTMWYNL